MNMMVEPIKMNMPVLRSSRFFNSCAIVWLRLTFTAFPLSTLLLCPLLDVGLEAGVGLTVSVTKTMGVPV